jgi:hypothetical protein
VAVACIGFVGDVTRHKVCACVCARRMTRARVSTPVRLALSQMSFPDFINVLTHCLDMKTFDNSTPLSRVRSCKQPQLRVRGGAGSATRAFVCSCLAQRMQVALAKLQADVASGS